ncbi:MAG: alpha-amylase family glycosyl hydrolase, partial [Candidatus Angelobacter sp.]
MALQRISDLDFKQVISDHDAPYFPSPPHWEDEVLYFMLVDRFSDGQEKDFLDVNGLPVNSGSTPMFTAADAGNAIANAADAAAWRDAGGNFVGGNLRGLASKMGYLRRLGVTAIWLSPVFKQVNADNSYHGYGIQNFFDVDPHFGTRDDLRNMVRTAHENGIRVVLDIILNHTGQVFVYDPDRYDTVDGNGNHFKDPRWDGNPYRVKGFRDATGAPSLPFAAIDTVANPDAFPDAAVWPLEFQDPTNFTQHGHINNFDYFPEFLDGDFFTLKDLHHGTRVMVNNQDQIDQYIVSPTLVNLCQVYKFWIAFADLDGFRIDTVKHMDPGATRFFAGVIHEFAESLGKENFYLIAEITGGRERAYDTQQVTGVDAVLGLDDVQDKLEYLTKGYRNPTDYFDLFRNSLQVRADSHVWFRDKVVTMTDDHDQIRKDGNKGRFCAADRGSDLLIAMLGLNAATMGIPCIYYGTEQAFDGAGSGDGCDRYIRESMFGGKFGAFRTHDRHFFNEQHPAYVELTKILALLEKEPALRRGRQFLREISGDGTNFGLPTVPGGQLRSVVPWSRIFVDDELVCAINTDPDNARSAWVTIDNSLHSAGEEMTCLYSSDKAQIGQSVTV